MTPEALCAASAAARAVAVLFDPSIDRSRLAPPHPAFLGFRRMTYIWLDGTELAPIGDALESWLAFLDTRGVSDAALELDAGPRIRALTSSGTDVWEVRGEEGQMRMLGQPAGDTRPAPGDDPAACAIALRDAVTAAMAGAEDKGRLAELERAVGILGASDDGSDVSDVAWPYFVLPEAAYGAPERRLFAAACAAWPLPDAMRAACAAVNAARPDATAARRPVQ